jgi:hypothetical protein
MNRDLLNPPPDKLERIVATELVRIDTSGAEAVLRGAPSGKPRKKLTVAERQARAKARVAKLRRKQTEPPAKKGRKKS